MTEPETQIVKSPIRAGERGIVLHSIEDMFRFAKAVQQSRLAPASFDTPEKILIAVQMGAELGMTPMRSLQSFAVVNGNARLWGDAPLSLVRESGLLEYIKESIEGDIGNDLSETSEEVKAVCITKRKGDPEEKKTEFSVSDAIRAGLWNQKTFKGYDSVWMKYPKRMLQMRARALNLRDNFPDAMSGQTIAEEYEGLPPEPAYEPTTLKRADRIEIDYKPIDVVPDYNPVADEATIATMLLGIKEKFTDKLCKDTGQPIETEKSLYYFLQFTTYFLGGESKDYTKEDGLLDPSKFNVEQLAKLNSEIDNEMKLPKAILDLIPQPEKKGKKDEQLPF